MGRTSSIVAGPTASCRRFRFVFGLGHGADTRRRRRRADVAEYLDGWVPLRVIAEQITGKQCYVWVELSRPVEVAAAAGYAKECPGYVRRSFKVLE